jgi:hypothetical protein
MVKEFLKIAGVKTQSEFYKKYPSEQAFFDAHPEALNLVNKTTSIPENQFGGEGASDSWVSRAANAGFSCGAHPRSELRQSYSDRSNPSNQMDRDELKQLKGEYNASPYKDSVNINEYYIAKNLADNRNRKMTREDKAYSKFFDPNTGAVLPSAGSSLGEEGNLITVNRMFPGTNILTPGDVLQGIKKDYNITTPMNKKEMKKTMESADKIGFHKPKLAYGGMYAYQNGGEPVSNDYPNYAMFKQAHDAWEASQNTPQVDEAAYMAAASQGNIPNAVSAPQGGYQAYPPIYMPPVDQQTSAQMAPSPNGGGYSGGSIVDFLKSQGMASDFATRKQMAESLGMDKYTGNKDQNIALLNSLSQAAFFNRQAAENPFIMEGSRNPDIAPTSGFAGFGQYPGMGTNPGIPSVPVVGAPVVGGGAAAIPTKKSSSGAKGAAIAAGVALGTGVAAGAFSEIKDLMKRASKGEYLSGQAKAKVTAYRNQFRNQMLKEAGKDIKAQTKWFDKLPKEQQSILKNLDAMEISGDMHLMPKGTASRDLYTRDMLNEANAENMLTSTNDALREAEEEAKVLRSVNAKKAAAARWGTKAVEAEKALGLGDRLMGGLKAIGRAKYIAPVADAAKGFLEAFHRDGGESGTYSNGVYYQAGGSYNPTTVNYGNTLPQFGMGKAMYGMGMAYGGDSPDGRALVNKFANGGVQNLYDAGYNLEYLAQGGPTFSAVTGYPHQAYVPAYDWMAYGGPAYSNVTQYNHQQYVPALDWMQNGGMNSGMMMRDNQYAQGGLVRGSVHDVSEEDIQHLINQGYKIQYL